MSDNIQRVGILTGGGDAPGLNAVIRAAVLTAHHRYGYEMVGIREGFDGLLNQLPLVELDPDRVRGLHMRGGTILGAANRGSPFARPVEQPDGTIEKVDVSHEAVGRLAEANIDALIVAGGDGTMGICSRLGKIGVKIVGVPKTIDNDLAETDVTFGFDTAISTATEALDKLQTTAESHHRVMVLEVMGRDAGWIALKAGVAGGADVILLPEIPFRLEHVFDKIREINRAGRRHSLVVVAEGAHAAEGDPIYYLGEAGEVNARLGGVGNYVGEAIREQMNTEVRVTVLGHLQRGGQPTPRDRWLATRFGSMAVNFVAQAKWGRMVALQGTRLVDVPIEAAAAMNFVAPDGEMVQMARDLGITLGD
jgi:ATP-dependent phosphofructokinase / diphosphate-dependent phosphofructokinase